MMSLIAYEPSFAIKASLGTKMFPGVLRTMGSERLLQYAEAAESGAIHGCFALTEVSHGSNALGMRTRATYDSKSRQFIIHTPDFESAKCWIGVLGKTGLFILQTLKYCSNQSMVCFSIFSHACYCLCSTVHS